PTISVLVAARNEAERLGACLEALRQQSYPPDHIEIIVADDHSTDGTADVARRHGVHCVRLRSEEPTGKAAALHAAFEISRGSVLLVTDADCRPPRDWARNLTAQFDTPRAGIVCGVTSIRDGGLLARLQAFDWALLLTVAAGLSAIGKPLTAMGNNMAIRREAYLAVGGYPAL
ncbi:MAG: glycosyltransferase, partial [Rhodothermales bacterium]